MVIRFVLTILPLSLIIGCTHNVTADMATPDCTRDGKGMECRSQPTEPPPMSRDPFFDTSI